MYGDVPHAQEEGIMQVVTETFWENLNGRIVCQDHIGVEASAKLCKSPKTITTSMTKWFKMNQEEVKIRASVNHVVHGASDAHQQVHR
jgi:hypothetical protein